MKTTVDTDVIKDSSALNTAMIIVKFLKGELNPKIDFSSFRHSRTTI